MDERPAHPPLPTMAIATMALPMVASFPCVIHLSSTQEDMLIYLFIYLFVLFVCLLFILVKLNLTWGLTLDSV